jgi:hypothetical protein
VSAQAIVLCGLMMATLVSAQTLALPDRIDRLSAKAKESTNITLDGPLLKLAGMFLNSNDTDQAAAKAIISKLNGIHVRTFEFENEGAYSDADLDSIRTQLKSPEWSRIVESRDKGQHAQIFVKQDKNGIAGLVVLSAERKELSIVMIDGAIDLKQLSSLGGNFGIPKDLPK